MPDFFEYPQNRSTFVKKMNKERNLCTLEKNIQDSVTAYKHAVEKWLDEVGVPLSLYDDSTNKAGIKIQFIEDNTVKNLFFDMIKFDKSTGNILVHQLDAEQETISRWIPISPFGDKAIEVYKSILWLDKDDLIVLDGDTHSGTANLVWSFSSKPLYFLHTDGHIVDVGWYEGGIDNFIGCYGEFAVHRYDWSIAMREIDEHEEDMEEEIDDYNN